MNVGSVKYIFDNPNYRNCGANKDMRITTDMLELFEEEKIMDYLQIGLVRWGSALCQEVYGKNYKGWVKTQMEFGYLRIEGIEAITVQQVLPAPQPRIPKAQVEQEHYFLTAVAEGGVL
ncbi:MAG: hypothetical protein ACOVQA_04790 [Thermoflexibacteraceae bacterium]|jgi:hypothetical protein